jgi:hypothetical protein
MKKIVYGKCPVCKRDFRKKSHGMTKAYCGARCKMLAYWERRILMEHHLGFLTRYKNVYK